MITTGTGDIERSVAGFVLPHEHLFCDLRSLVNDYDDPALHRVFNEKITLQNYGHLTRNIVPMLEDYGLKEADIRRLTSENPAQFSEKA